MGAALWHRAAVEVLRGLKTDELMHICTFFVTLPGVETLCHELMAMTRSLPLVTAIPIVEALPVAPLPILSLDEQLTLSALVSLSSI